MRIVLTDPDYRIRYNKNLKSTGKPIIIWDVKKEIEYTTDCFELDNCKIQIVFGNSIKQEKACGATTILKVWANEPTKHTV